MFPSCKIKSIFLSCELISYCKICLVINSKQIIQHLTILSPKSILTYSRFQFSIIRDRLAHCQETYFDSTVTGDNTENNTACIIQLWFRYFPEKSRIQPKWVICSLDTIILQWFVNMIYKKNYSIAEFICIYKG